jgi:thiol-disulfide isomerase/thioredoxin
MLFPTRPALLVAAIALAAGPLAAQQTEPSAGQPSRELMQQLFGQNISKEELQATIKKANLAGVPRQQIIEAKLVWGLRRQDAAWLSAMIPELDMLAKSHEPADAAVLKTREEVRGFIAYAKALKATAEGAVAEFETQMKEAFWLAPNHASLFAETLNRQRRQQAMAALKLDMQAPLALSNGETTTLAEQVAGKKGLLIDFWASWCGPCMKLMPALKKKAQHLQPLGIAVAGMNKDDDNAASVAERIRQEQAMEIAWMIEPAQRPFTKQLQIDSIPRMILLSPEGRVLFNGHPEDPSLWQALQQLDPAIKAP